MELIPLDAVLAEIDKLYQQHSSKEYIDEAGCVLDKLEDIINSLEVKEVNPNDAFIEKAVSYLNSKLYDWVQTTNPNQRSCANTIMKQDFIENFRKYMEV